MTLASILGWFGWDDSWQRPRPVLGRVDVLLGLISALMAWLNVAAVQSFSPWPVTSPWWQQALAIASASLLLVLRRRAPVVVMVALGIHFWLVATLVPMVGYSFVYQIMPFMALYSGIAWARDRRAAVLGAAGLAIGLVLWLAWLFAVGRGLDSLSSDQSSVPGPFTPAVGAMIYTILTNTIYFLASTLMGNVSWRKAKDEADLRHQAVVIGTQAASLAENAVTEERLRLARELHDVVAHHIALIGVQAAAARRVMSRDPALAIQALGNVEQASRDAVSQMRGLLGTLRSPREETGSSRAPEPTLAEVPALLDQVRSAGLDVSWSLVESAPGAASGLSMPLELTIYRTIQESLANVRRHSTARQAQVVVRVDRPRDLAEVEITDDGRTRIGTSGSGFGQRGIRERVATLGGSVEMRPRTTGGYLVHARLPLGGATSLDPVGPEAVRGAHPAPEPGPGTQPSP